MLCIGRERQYSKYVVYIIKFFKNSRKGLRRERAFRKRGVSSVYGGKIGGFSGEIGGLLDMYGGK